MKFSRGIAIASLLLVRIIQSSVHWSEIRQQNHSQFARKRTKTIFHQDNVVGEQFSLPKPDDQVLNGLRRIWNGLSMPKEEIEALMVAPPRYGAGDRPSNLRIAFLGDSVTRYQAVSLIHYLHFGSWIHDEQRPNLLMERSYRFWNKYYDGLVEKINGSQNNCTNETSTPTLQCDCFRDWGNFERWGRNFAENVYYWDPCLQNAVYSMTSLGELPFRGRVPLDQIYLDLSPVNGRTRFQWQFTDWGEFLRHHLAKLNPPPDYVVMNTGIWPNHTFSNKTALHQIHEAMGELNITGIYKTTSCGQNATFHLLEHDQWGCQMMDLCIPLNWTGHLANNKLHKWDNYHYTPHVNTRFNEQLFDVLLRAPKPAEMQNAKQL